MPEKSLTIWVTGASGFLGANIVEYLLNHQYKVIATIRSQTDFWRCKEFLEHPCFTIINTDTENYESKLIDLKPDILIHSAWGGVSVSGRSDWDIQMKNINFTFRLLSLSQKAGVKKVIVFGSQAEYGQFNGRVNESHECNPDTAYGAAKIAAFHLTKLFCTQHHIQWYWLRLFSMLGKKEDSNWLISSVINNILHHKETPLTSGEQKYDYVDMRFLMNCLHKVIQATDKSGLYNLGSNTSIQLKDLLQLISQKLSNYNPVLFFGALPYRPNQVMHMEGDSSKFYNTFEVQNDVNIESGLDEVILDLKHKLK